MAQYKSDCSGLDAAKIAAIHITENPLLSSACPRSGKTRTIVEKVLYLLLEKKITPQCLFVSTVTEKAAHELLTRISGCILETGASVNLQDMYLGTLHSLFLWILEENRDFARLKKNYHVLDQCEQTYFIYRRLKEFRKIECIAALWNEKDSVWDKTEQLLKAINKVSEEMLEAPRLAAASDLAVKALGEAYLLYQRRLEIYAHLVEERTSQPVSRVHLYYTGEKAGNPYITYDYKKGRVEKTIRQFDAVVDRIEAGECEPAAGKKCGKLCGTAICGFTAIRGVCEE